MSYEFIAESTAKKTDNLTGENPSYSQIEEMEIEAIAQLLKNGQLPGYKYRAVVDLLVRKLSHKAHQGWATQLEVADKTFEEMTGSDGVSGIISSKSIEYALKAYGKLDKKTGKLIPFEKLFWAAFGLKNQDIITEHLNNTKGDEQKARNEAVKQLVQVIAKKNKKQHLIPRINLLKKDNLRRVLKDVGGTEEDIKVGDRLLEESLVCRDLCFDEIGEESGGYLSDAVSIDNNHDADAALDMLVSAMQEAKALAKNDKERKTLLCVATLRIADYIPSGNYAAIADLPEFVDCALLEKLHTTRRRDTELLMEYLQIQDRELRRRLKRAKELLDMGFDLALGSNSVA